MAEMMDAGGGGHGKKKGGGVRAKKMSTRIDMTPMVESEEKAWEDGFDPCMHVVRLGSEEDWGY